MSEPKSASSNKNTAGKLSNSDKSVKSFEGSSNKNTNKFEQQEHGQFGQVRQVLQGLWLRTLRITMMRLDGSLGRQGGGGGGNGGLVIYGEDVRVQSWWSRDGRLMTRIIENGFIVNIFFFEEWTASFFVHCLGWWTLSTLLRNLELGLCEATLFSLSAVIATIIKINLIIRSSSPSSMSSLAPTSSPTDPTEL